MKFKSAVVALSLSIAVAPAQLARADWLTDFYNTAGAGINVTAPGAYQTQAGGTVALGGFSMRVPPRNLQLYGFTPPGLKMGCGGIDAWAGSFGFINKDQFVAFLRNIGQNALGYFFQLALKTMAPEIEGTISYLQNIAREMNANTINSCQTMNNLFANTPSSEIGASFEQRASNLSAGMGMVSDRFSATVKNVGSLPEQMLDMANAKAANPTLGMNAGNKPVTIDGPTNVLFKALTSGSDPLSTDEINLLLSLVGTVLLTPTTSGTTGVAGGDWSTVPIKQTIDLKQFIGDRNTPVEAFPINVCATADPLCMTINPGTNTTSGFAFVAKKNLLKIRAQILAKASQDPVALDILMYSSEPVYRLLAITAKPARETLANTIIDAYADAVAVDLTTAYLRSILFEANRLISSQAMIIDKGESVPMRDMVKRIDHLLGEAATMRAEKQAEVAAKAANIAMVLHLESTLRSGLSAQIRSALIFANNNK